MDCTAELEHENMKFSSYYKSVKMCLQMVVVQAVVQACTGRPK